MAAIPRLHPVVVTMKAYEATDTGARLHHWERNSYGPNAALDDADVARARSQEAVRNNPWISRALNLTVSHQIGCGIQPRPQIPDPQRESVLRLWNDSVHEMDADGVLDFYSLQTLMARAAQESGECFIRLRPRRPEDPLRVPLQIQIIESALVPVHHNSSNGGNPIRQGIELTPFGRRVAYWMYRAHPGDSYQSTSREIVRVPADLVLHHYEPLRPGQLRGAPTPLSALVRAHKLDEYESAELTRKKNRAKFNGAIYRENPDDNPLTGSAPRTEDGRSLVDIEEGYLLQLALNEKVELYGGDTGNAGALDFLRTHLRAIAAGMGVPYELVTGDYSGTNDRIMRVILNTFYRTLEIAQERLIHQVLQPVWNAWLQAAVQTGRLHLPGYLDDPTPWHRCEWRAHAWSYVNPLQEAQTAILKIDNGLTSRSAAVAETGWDADDIDRQQADDHARERKLRLRYGAGVAGEPATADDQENSPPVKELPA